MENKASLLRKIAEICLTELKWKLTKLAEVVLGDIESFEHIKPDDLQKRNVALDATMPRAKTGSPVQIVRSGEFYGKHGIIVAEDCGTMPYRVEMEDGKKEWFAKAEVQVDQVERDAAEKATESNAAVAKSEEYGIGADKKADEEKAANSWRSFAGRSSNSRVSRRHSSFGFTPRCHSMSRRFKTTQTR